MKRTILWALVLVAGVSSASRAEDDKQPAQASVELSPYDAGYATAAAQECPGTLMVIKLDDSLKAQSDFKRGAGMFAHYKELQKLEGACKAAMNLYNSKTGKVAKLLDQPTKP